MRRSGGWVFAVVLGSLTPAAGGELVVEVHDAKGRPLPDAIVTATGPAPVKGGERPAATIDQIDQEFVPRVSAVRVGTAVRFPNQDNIRHHVYSFSPAKQFELPLYKGTQAAPVVFDRPGLVVLGCNIHDWMLGYLYVVETPWFARTGADGRARLTGLPDAPLEIAALHPRARTPDAPPRARWSPGDATTLTIEVPVRAEVPRPRAGRSAERDYR
jgi:plastocyanin